MDSLQAEKPESPAGLLAPESPKGSGPRTRSVFLFLSGQFLLVALALLLTAIWIAAFLSPSRSVTITIDSLGEAVPELVLLVGVLPLALFSIRTAFLLILRVGLPGYRPSKEGERITSSEDPASGASRP